MSEMVERVARAIAETLMAIDQKRAENSGHDIMLVIDAYMPPCRLAARAAIGGHGSQMALCRKGRQFSSGNLDSHDRCRPQGTGEGRMSEEIQKRGANARALGKSVFDNPFLKSEEMPRATGETIEEWQAKHDAWELGWRMENAMRSA
ncbi:hypothetical protein ELI01_18635 [Rhizobium leguminosarum]|uniref:CrpP-related protein n=1 Tax=Rhizobium leguminosarum TaxID=384 RepID=UPI00102F4520|nr:CrpP-related protein [Rhizobium leguminosarum]TAX57099.1 hypothetical protein ELI01_18635 [Rhizobium leguminosarum]